MVTRHCSKRLSERGSMTGELLVAMSLLVASLLPIAYAIRSEADQTQAYYQKAVAMEIVDGELEVLLAGGWRQFSPGTQNYTVRSLAVKNLSEGKFLFTLQTNLLRLEWRPAEKHQGGPVMREVTLK